MYIFQVGEAKKHTHILWVYVFLLLPPPPPFQTKPHPPLFFSSSEIYCLVGGGGVGSPDPRARRAEGRKV